MCNITVWTHVYRILNCVFRFNVEHNYADFTSADFSKYNVIQYRRFHDSASQMISSTG